MSMRTWFPCIAGVLGVCAVAVSPARAQDVQALASELAALRDEVRQLREEVRQLRGGAVADAGAPPAPDQAPRLPPPIAVPPAGAQAAPAAAIELLGAQVAELAQTKVESASRLPVRLFGTVHAHAFANTGEANWLDIPNLVPPPPVGGPSGTFAMGVRQSRIGLLLDGPRLGDLRTSGTVLVDFFGGVPGFQTGQVMPLPRLLVGFLRMATDRTALQVGQDHVVLAPRDPTSLAALAFPSLFRSGNLYLRAPQVRLDRTLGPTVTATAALVAPVGGDVTGEEYRFVPPALGGERARRPGVQGRVAFATSSDEQVSRFGSVAVSAHHGAERRGATTVDSWAGAVDFAVRRHRLGVAGELFTGRNIDAFGGATGLDARSSGGWAELQVFPATRLSLHAGGGLDRLHADDAPRARRRNQSVYGSAILALTPEWRTSVEYKWLETQPGVGSGRSTHHVDWAVAYSF
jgi:hypothetical protein